MKVVDRRRTLALLEIGVTILAAFIVVGSYRVVAENRRARSLLGARSP